MKQSVIVHTFRMSDVEDPDLWAGQTLYEWEHSEAGQWIMQNSIEQPSWHRHMDPSTYGYLYTVRAYLTDKAYTYWKLKYE
jgi:hypothetical protein